MLANEQRLSNILVFEGWAADGRATDLLPTGLEDAVRLLVLSGRHARPDTSKDILRAVIESWPVGQRMRLSLRDDKNGTRVDAVHAVISGSAAPNQATEADAVASVVVAEEEGDDAQIDDAAPELDTAWPSANPPEPDSDALARRALLDSREVEAEEESCGLCQACLEGNFAECSNPHTTRADDAVDVLAAWRDRATAGLNVTSPLVQGADDSEGAWWEIVGYWIHASGEPVVVVIRDWRPNGMAWYPAQHPDLVPGQHIELVVGPMFEDHRDALRVMWRRDRPGQFLLREANLSPQKQEEYSQLAISLSQRYQGLLKRLPEGTTLSATVVPRHQPGILTVTLLELLHQHFQCGNAQRARNFEVRFQDGRSGEVAFYPARVISARNRNGYIDTELLVRDSSRGIVHGFAFLEPDDSETPDIDTPIWLRLRPEQAKLSLRDIDLGPIRKLRSEEPSLQLMEGELTDRPAEDNDEDEEATNGGDVNTESTKGGLDSILISRRAVPQHVARQLVDMSSQPDWTYKVWRFWAQSRYLRTDRRDAFRPGGPTETVEMEANLRPELPPPPEVTLDVPADKKGQVIGRGGERLRQFRAKPGVLYCYFGRDADEYRLHVKAETQEQLDSLVSDISEIVNRVNRVPDQERQMYVPAGMNGRLIGTGGATIRELLRLSGCSAARAIDNGSTWVVKGPSVTQIEEFARLAAWVVPGCQLL